MLLIVTFVALTHFAAAKDWAKVSTGHYTGYAQDYTVSEGTYKMLGATSLGVECSLDVSIEGVICDGTFFKWVHPGMQAERETTVGSEKINFRGRAGNVVVADFVVETPDSPTVYVMRMCVAPSPTISKTPSNEVERFPETGGKE